MSDKIEKRSIVYALVITIPAFAGAIFFISYLLLSHRPLQMGEELNLPTQIPARLVSDLMFAPSGRLVAIVESPGVVEAYTWDTQYRPTRPPKVVVDFGSLIGRPVSAFILRSPLTTGAASTPQSSSSQAPPVPILPYAISDDGSMIAWSWEGELFAGPLTAPKKFRVQLTPPTPAVALSFIDSDVVAAIHSSRELRLERLSRPDPNLPGTRLQGDWRISGRGPFRLLSRFETHNVVLMSPRQKQVFQGFPASSNGTFLAASKKGEVAVGTAEGVILFPRAFGPSPSAQLPAFKAVQALAFYEDDDRHVIAGQEGGGLFWVDPAKRQGEQVIPLVGHPVPDVRLIAVRSSRIALVTSRSIVTGILERHLVLGDSQKWVLGLTFSLLSGLAFLRLIVTDAFRLYDLSRSGPEPCPSPGSDQAEHGKEGSESSAADDEGEGNQPPEPQE